jgi:hypothetical protein
MALPTCPRLVAERSRMSECEASEVEQPLPHLSIQQMAPPDSARGIDLLVTDNMIGNIGPV